MFGALGSISDQNFYKKTLLARAMQYTAQERVWLVGLALKSTVKFVTSQRYSQTLT